MIKVPIRIKWLPGWCYP